MTGDAAADASRYDVLAKIASGGMATVYVGALKGGSGLRHLVALKRPHQHLVDDPGFRESLLAEAHVASGIRHANVVSVREIERLGDSIQLVMDYVEGASLGQLLVHAAKQGPPVPPGVALRIVIDACAGLEALHELTDDAGRKLGFIHRDVSPQNVLVGVDGVARITDFGLAKCAHSGEQPTTQGTLKGKLGYMAPEYVRSKPIDARADVFAMGVVAWEALAGKRLFRGESDADTIERVLTAEVAPPGKSVAGLAPEVDAAVMRALERSPEARFSTIRELSEALAAAGKGMIATAAEVGALVRASIGDELAARRKTVGERFSTEPTAGRPRPSTPAPPVTPPEGTQPRAQARRPLVALALGALVLAAIGGSLTMRPRAGTSPPPPTPSITAAPSASASAAPPSSSAAPSAPSSLSPAPDAAVSSPLSAPPPAQSRPPRRHHPGTPPPHAEPSSPPAPKPPPPNPYAP